MYIKVRKFSKLASLVLRHDKQIFKAWCNMKTTTKFWLVATQQVKNKRVHFRDAPSSAITEAELRQCS